MFGRESLRELVRNLHEEFESSTERREEESRRWQGEQRERFEQLAEETREFNREILLRNEKVYTAVLERLEALGREIEEGRLQIKANTEAVLRMLDRFDEPGGAEA